ncbi:MAG: GNAT family N-acetyltransferase [Pseudomonadota bacterium]
MVRGGVLIGDLRSYPDDFPQVAIWVWQQWRVLEPGRRLTEAEQAVAEEFINHDAPFPACFVAFHGGTLVGMANLSGPDSDIAAPYDAASPWISSVFVPETHRGRGIALSILTHIVEAARAAGIEDLHVHTTDGHELYRKAGFHEIGKADYLGRETTVMRMTL